MTQPIAGGRPNWAGVGSPLDWAPVADADALHRREENFDPPVPLPPWPRAGLPGAASRVALVVPASAQAERDAQVQAGLDSFRMAMTAPYRTPEGIASPGTPFQMSTPYPGQVAALAANEEAVAKAAARAHLTPADWHLVRSGRGTPVSIHALTQALLDGGLLPAAPDPPRPVDLEARVRQVMFDCGIGIDCAGYVQLAYLRAMGVSASAAGFGPRLREDLSNLSTRGFHRIEDLSQVRPGDVVVLGPPPPPPPQPGHRAIVYEQHLASYDDLQELRDRGGPAREFASKPPIRVLTVDSSWGCNGEARYGGVRRESWWYSPSTGQWAWFDQGDDNARGFGLARAPLNHPLDPPFGIYRGAHADEDHRTFGSPGQARYIQARPMTHTETSR